MASKILSSVSLTTGTNGNLKTFSIIPILAGISHLLLTKYISKKNIYKFIIILLVTFSTTKYHLEYNEKRKFMDLQNVNLDKAVNANLIDKKFRNLKWITPFFSGTPEEEIILLKKTMQIIKADNRKKMIITPYQFFSVLLEEDLNIPNRWYLDNASHPNKSHKYFRFYKQHFVNNLKKNKIKVIYTIGSPKIEDFKIYMDDICYTKKKINKITSIHQLNKCE